MKRYINRKDQSKEKETVDEFPYNTKEEKREAERCLREYQLSDPSAQYYLSYKPTKCWGAHLHT